MKSLTRLVISFFACCTLVLTAFAGPEHISSKDKEVMAAPAPACNWSGFYVGLNMGAAFGWNEATDIDGWNNTGQEWTYQIGGFTGAAEAGYNFQFGSFVIGPEVDVGYMSLGTDNPGHGSFEPNNSFHDTFGQNDSNFYTTFRARLGWSVGNWLLFATGGGMGLNDQARVVDKTDGPTSNTLAKHDDNYDFLWGWTIGGGAEYMFNCHWSMKVEYLYFSLEDNTISENEVQAPFTFRFGNSIDGNVVRLGLNYKF